MTYKDESSRFALNHHAGVLKVRDSKILNIEYFKHRFEKFLINLSVSDGSKTLSKNLLEKQSFELPSLPEQESILRRYQVLESTKLKIDKYYEVLSKLQHQMLDVPEVKTDRVPLTDLFIINQGHQITDLELYSNDGQIPVYTGNNEIKGRWGKHIVNKEDLPCLSYPSKANSGVVYIQSELFDANNTALLIPKPEWRNKLHLEWFRLKLPPIFLDLMTSKEGVSYLNKDIVESIYVELPVKEMQIEQASYFTKIENMKKDMESLNNKIELLLSRQIMAN
jgi:restriction endonuclease S subunit